ncbi:hypothetical protein [Actinoplanes sp. DH11]|uniref:hypothetical protein n=1 Tax=Actinoplanes sp. DH11 TaxID=2857011 RepID=UPI001E57E777|nr:hypothetical protein [Actinoplanes sp. DH11]
MRVVPVRIQLSIGLCRIGQLLAARVNLDRLGALQRLGSGTTRRAGSLSSATRRAGSLSGGQRRDGGGLLVGVRRGRFVVQIDGGREPALRPYLGDGLRLLDHLGLGCRNRRGRSKPAHRQQPAKTVRLSRFDLSGELRRRRRHGNRYGVGPVSHRRPGTPRPGLRGPFFGPGVRPRPPTRLGRRPVARRTRHSGAISLRRRSVRRPRRLAGRPRRFRRFRRLVAVTETLRPLTGRPRIDHLSVFEALRKIDLDPCEISLAYADRLRPLLTILRTRLEALVGPYRSFFRPPGSGRPGPRRPGVDAGSRDPGNWLREPGVRGHALTGRARDRPRDPSVRPEARTARPGGRISAGSGGRVSAGSGGRVSAGSGGRVSAGSGGRVSAGSGERVNAVTGEA